MSARPNCLADITSCVEGWYAIVNLSGTWREDEDDRCGVAAFLPEAGQGHRGGFSKLRAQAADHILLDGWH